jgi:hypothetical protein
LNTLPKPCSINDISIIDVFAKNTTAEAIMPTVAGLIPLNAELIILLDLNFTITDAIIIISINDGGGTGTIHAGNWRL